MDINGLECVDFGFENCDGITIPAERILRLEFEVDENEYITDFHCVINGDGGCKYSREWMGNRLSPVQRIAAWDDIVTVSIKFTGKDEVVRYVIWDEDGSDENNSYQKTVKTNDGLLISIRKENEETDNGGDDYYSHYYGDYGIVKEYGDCDLWFEPITDELDGFVLRSLDQSIKAVYTKQ